MSHEGDFSLHLRECFGADQGVHQVQFFQPVPVGCPFLGEVLVQTSGWREAWSWKLLLWRAGKYFRFICRKISVILIVNLYWHRPFVFYHLEFSKFLCLSLLRRMEDAIFLLTSSFPSFIWEGNKKTQTMTALLRQQKFCSLAINKATKLVFSSEGQ